MAPYVPDEINVYSVPHSRMKELVNSYFTLVGFDLLYRIFFNCNRLTKAPKQGLLRGVLLSSFIGIFKCCDQLYRSGSTSYVFFFGF
jgi:hypothetical protein